MSQKLPWKTNIELPTEQQTFSDFELLEAARGGDASALVELQGRESSRMQGLPERYERTVIPAPDGSEQVVFVLKPYHDHRPSFLRRAWRVGATAAAVMIAMAAIYAIWGPVSGWRLYFEVAADILVIAGTFFTARGAFLGIKGTRWLQELVYQHKMALNRQISPRQSDVTRQLMSILDEIKAELPRHRKIVTALDTVRESLSQQLGASTSGFSRLQILSNLDIAELFLDASSGAVLGSILIVGGTLILAILALHGS